MSTGAYGECVIRDCNIRGPDRQPAVEILRADPRILVDGRVLDEIRQGKDHPSLTLNGGVLTIRAINRTVVYRLVGRHPDPLNHPHTWVAEWPD